ncbi:MAG: PH domain-containing protein [Gammaproteobacteria bacterium]|nr:PH domain-containing protein [Gammaproteobacteria bacterium]
MSETSEQALELFRSGEIAGARIGFQSAIVEVPDSSLNRYYLAVCEFRLKNFEESRKQLWAAIRYNPSYAKSWYYLGLIEERTGGGLAKQYFEAALLADPDFAKAREKLGKEQAHNVSGSKTAPVPVSIPQDRQQSDTVSVLEEDDPAGPGKLVYSSQRRLSSFGRHVFLLLLLLPLSIIMLAVLHEFRGPKELVLIIIPLLVIIVLDAFLRSRTTRYVVHERRLDIHSGILFRTVRSVWLFKIADLTMKRSPIDLLTRNATIDIEAETGNVGVTGLVPPKGERAVLFAHKVFDELRTAVRDQRGEIKKMWY